MWYLISQEWYEQDISDIKDSNVLHLVGNKDKAICELFSDNEKEEIPELDIETVVIDAFSKQIAKDIGIQGVETLEDLCKHPAFLKKVEQMITKNEQQELETGNRRPIDKYLFDPINKICNIKTGIYKQLVKDSIITPSTKEPEQKLDHIEDGYFDFEESNHKKKEELAKMKNAYTNIEIDDTIPLDIQYIIFQTYKRYPELRWKNIVCKWVNGFTTMPSKQHVMRSQIDIASIRKEILCKKAKNDRKYIIYVNLLDQEWVVTLPQLDQNSRWGVMSHELHHTLHYSLMSPKKYAKFGLWFISSPRWTREMEKRTDIWSIARGTGYGLFHFRKKILQRSNFAYTNYKRRTYLTPEEILYAILAYYKSYSKETVKKVIQHIINKDF